MLILHRHVPTLLTLSGSCESQELLLHGMAMNAVQCDISSHSCKSIVALFCMIEGVSGADLQLRREEVLWGAVCCVQHKRQPAPHTL